MTPAEYEEGLKKAAKIQRAAGWDESSIMLYAMDHRACTDAMGGPKSILLVGAGLAQDNSRYGVTRNARH